MGPCNGECFSAGDNGSICLSSAEEIIPEPNGSRQLLSSLHLSVEKVVNLQFQVGPEGGD